MKFQGRRQERVWAEYFTCADRCRFRRNTLLTLGDVRIVVSTVGLMVVRDDSEKFTTIGVDRHYFETRAFHADATDERYHDADMSRQVGFSSPWSISEIDADDRANDMHEAVVSEISDRMDKGEFNLAPDGG